MLVTGGHGRRTAPVALARCRAPRLNRFVLSTKIVVRSVASTFILGTGEGEGDARRLGLGLGLVHCRDPVVNWSSSAPLVVTWIS